MPYYIYRIQTLGVLQKLEQHERFAEASARAKALRAAEAPGVAGKVKVMFAENELQAEDLLSQVREAGPAGDD
jgi:hypothetical protein